MPRPPTKRGGRTTPPKPRPPSARRTLRLLFADMGWPRPPGSALDDLADALARYLRGNPYLRHTVEFTGRTGAVVAVTFRAEPDTGELLWEARDAIPAEAPA